IVEHKRPLSLAMLVLAALFAALALTQVVLQFRSKSGNIPIGFWAGALSLLWLVGGLRLILQQGNVQLPVVGPGFVMVVGLRPGEGRYRLLALALGSLVGLNTFILGLWL